MQKESKISLAGWWEFLVRSKAGICQKTINGVILLRIGRIHHHSIEVCRFIRRPVCIQRVTVTQMLKTARHTVKHHVHACQIERLILYFLAKVLYGMRPIDAVLYIILDEVSYLQKERTRTTGRVINSESILRILTMGHDSSDQRRDSVRGIELSSFLSGFRGKLRNQIFVGIPQSIFGIKSEINSREFRNHRGNQAITLVWGLT